MSNSFHSCPLCGSTGLDSMPRYWRSHLVRCNGCGFIFSRLKPTDEELTVHYSGYERQFTLSPFTRQRYEELLKEEFAPYNIGNRMLDVGCGSGYFLESAAKAGWQAFGTEFDPEAVDFCTQKGLNVFCGRISEIEFEPGSFDVITSFETIEHLNDPVKEVQTFYKLLRKGGLVYLTTPNFNSLSRYRLYEKWSVIQYPEHLSYFTPKTLAFLGKSAGFKVLKFRTTGISFDRWNDAGSSPVSVSDEELRTKIESSSGLKLLKEMANRMLSGFGVGDTIKMFWVKE